MIVLKTGLSGLTIGVLFKKALLDHEISVVAFFGIFYALSGYMAAYSWNIMWLDCILLFPAYRAGTGAFGKRRKGNAVLHYPWTVDPVQLLYLHHDLHFYGALFHSPAGAG